MNRPADLVTAYARAVDGRDWTALADLFTEEAVLVTPDPPRSLDPVLEARGRTAILAAVSKVSTFDRTEHVVTSTTWDVDGDVASGTTTGEAHHVVLGADPHAWVWQVEYADEAVQVAGGWRFARRALTVRAIEKRPVG